MASTLFYGIASAVTAIFLLLLSLLRRNLRLAKATGLPYVIVPFYYYSPTYTFFLSHGMNLLNKILGPPTSFLSWRTFQGSIWVWHFRYEPFRIIGDTFLTVSPTGLIMQTADAQVIAQINGRRADFPKPTHLFKIIDIYGENIISTEGQAWKAHRKLVGPAFSEQSNRLVWKESLVQAALMLDKWRQEEGKVQKLFDDAGEASLNVISKAGFGQDLHAKGDKDETKQELTDGHTMTFGESLTSLLDGLLPVMAIPKWLLITNTFRRSARAYDEWKQHMIRLINSKRAEGAAPANATTADILGQLAKGEESLSSKTTAALSLVNSQILSNSFVLLLAGHETVATSNQSIIILLAQHPRIQQKVQRAIDEVLQGRSVSDLDFDKDFPILINGYLGAVIHETLRVIPPVVANAKETNNYPQTLKINGREVTLPPNMIIKQCIAAVHRNPKFWAHAPPTDPKQPYWGPGGLDNDLEEFKPERWLRGSPKSGSHNDGGTKSANYESNFLHPDPGVYMPFAEGARSCIGRRFALVEMVAALAVVYSQHSIELAVDEWASDAEIELMGVEERRKLWETADAAAKQNWRYNVKQRFTLKMQGNGVPVRAVRRGEERFCDLK